MEKYTTIQDLRLLSESALESSLAGYWDWDIVKNEEFLSPRFKEMFGYEDHEMENHPDSWKKIAFQEDLPGMFEKFSAHVQSLGKISFNSIVRYHHKSGKTIWVRCHGKVVEWSENNEPLRAIGCHIDITEEKANEFRLKKAISERDVLLKEVHHRVKNNLQLLLSLTRLKNINGKVETHEVEDCINSISRAYEAIYQTETIADISIKSYLEQVIRPIATEHRLQYHIESVVFERNIDFLIPIGLIITELTNNSIKHSGIPSYKLKIKIDINKKDGNLNVVYSDNGHGYGEKLGEIDELDSFGLSIIEGLSNQLNGSIQLFDQEGACAVLTIKL